MPSEKIANIHDGAPKSKKRKEPHQNSSNAQNGSNGRVKRAKTNIMRSISTQNADSALKNGELDLQSFLKTREYEIKALEDGMRRSKASGMSRAFQQVPRDMRRRTASHNVKKVPKRLRGRAKREMKEDNTPTVSAKTRKPGGFRGRVRAETAKRLGILAAKKRAMRAKSDTNSSITGIESRVARPKIRRNLPNEPQKPRSKFRKRQIHKTWLPTHLWHAKRAKMTEPQSPLWRFALPITSTEKSYRPTHRAGRARGAVAWDASYMSTIGLEGPVESVQKVLKAMGIQEKPNSEVKWKLGKRSWCGWLSRAVQDRCSYIGPCTIIWCPPEQNQDGVVEASKKEAPRKLLIRLHPSTFLEAWTELLRLSKQQRPLVHVTDLRFEIGSIEITGPGSTEALLGVLHPYPCEEVSQKAHSETFRSLAAVTNPASLPVNALLSFSIMDPRIKFPCRPVVLPKDKNEDTEFGLLQMLSSWPVDGITPPSGIFDGESRFKATRLPSQKALNRRKAFAKPGEYPSIVPTDPSIPVLLLTSSTAFASGSQGTWTLLAPWKCILPIWYGLVHYPLSSGGNPRFGGLQELQQVHFEHGVPWFPADYPGTVAGTTWENDKSEQRKAEWERRPKGKRIAWDSLDLGASRKGELGKGWACDFTHLLGLLGTSAKAVNIVDASSTTTKVPGPAIEHYPTSMFTSLLSSVKRDLPPLSAVATVRIYLLHGGIARPSARIYQLPRSSVPQSIESTKPATTREEWMSLLPTSNARSNKVSSKSTAAKRTLHIPLNVPISQRVRLLAQSLLQNPPQQYPKVRSEEKGPLVPGEEDLIGFVTTGGFSLSEGKGVAVGCIVVAKTVERLREENKPTAPGSRLCVVRNAGEKVGRLAKWEAV